MRLRNGWYWLARRRWCNFHCKNRCRWWLWKRGLRQRRLLSIVAVPCSRARCVARGAVGQSRIMTILPRPSMNSGRIRQAAQERGRLGQNYVQDHYCSENILHQDITVGYHCVKDSVVRANARTWFGTAPAKHSCCMAEAVRPDGRKYARSRTTAAPSPKSALLRFTSGSSKDRHAHPVDSGARPKSRDTRRMRGGSGRHRLMQRNW